MAERDLEKLLGGYATGTLTEEERKALFEAALHDQGLFSALADEQALKELLDDPVSRRRLLEALEKASAHPAASWLTPVIDWFRRPVNLAFAGTLATAVIAIVVVVNIQRESAFGPADEFVTADSRSLAQPEPEPRAAQEEEALLAERAETEEKPTSLRRAARKPSAPAPPTRIAERTAPATAPAVGGPRPAEPPALRKAKKEASLPARELVASEEDAPAGGAFDKLARVPERPQPVPELEIAQAPAATAVEPQEAPARSRRFQASLAEPIEQGPARELFYGQARSRALEQKQALKGRAQRPSRPESQALGDEFQQEARSEVSGFRKSARIGGLASQAIQPMGLRYSILERGREGSYSEIDAAGPFSPDDPLRMTVEVNEPGFVYVVQQRPSGEWTWLFPTASPGARTAVSDARVVSRRRYVIPSSGNLPLTGPPGERRIVIVFSREPKLDLQALVPGVAGKKDRDDAKSGDLNRLLNRARAEATTTPLLVQKVDAAQPGSPPEQAVYVVNRNPGPAPSLVAEFLLSTR